MIYLKYFEGQDFDYVYHLADLHIRNLKRHSEYKTVFQRFLNNVKKDKLKNSLIYIGGDIAHAKTEMSPELVQMISWFLNECGKLLPTVLITGNHDCNHKNPSRLDVLTPIVDNINNPNVVYLRDTGVYELGNLTTGVYSILDEKENWPKGSDVDGEHKICFFHGPIDKSKTDIGYEVSSRSFTVDIFDGWDMAMLGDIHRRQIIQKYDKKNNKPIVVYVGSCLQQNHGELLNGHGYLIWDIKKRTFKEVDLKNDWGYMTVDVIDNKIPNWIYEERKNKLLPKYPRLRVRFTNTESSDMKLRIAELQTLFSVKEISYSRTDTISKLKLSDGVNESNIFNNIKDITSQNELITSFLERNFGITTETKEIITELNNKLNNELTSTDIVDKNILWEPVKFEFSNMFSYGEANTVNFENLKGLVGIFAPNASGKSSLFSALSFCIFDKSERAFKAIQILNNQKKNFKCKFQFRINNEDYFIERVAKMNKKGTAVKVDVEFWKINLQGERINLNGEQRRETNDIIETYLGTYDDFILTTLSLQGNNALFIDKSQTERKDILSQFTGVDIFDKLSTIALDINRENQTLIKNFNTENYSEKLSDLTLNISRLDLQYQQITDDIDELEKEEDEIIEKIEELNEKLVSLSTTVQDINVLTQKRELLNSELSDINTNIENENEKIKSTVTEHDTLKGIFNKLDEDELKRNFNRLKTLNTNKIKLNHEKDKINLKIEGFMDRLKEVSDYEYDDTCDFCVKNADTVIKTRENSKNEINRLTIHLNKLVNELNDITEDIIDIKSAEEKWNGYIDLKNSIYEKERKIQQHKEFILTQNNNTQRINEKLKENKKNIEEYYKFETDIEKNKEIKLLIADYKDELSNTKESLNEYNKDILQVNGKLSTSKSEKQYILSQIDKIKKLEEEQKALELYIEAVKRDGVPYELIKQSMPAIEGEINNILSQIVEFSMELEMDGKNINAYINYDNQRWALELCSGMERFISGLAIRVALINICNLPHPTFLIIDEGLGSLDSENLQSVFMLFNYLKTQFEFVVLISHLDTSRDFADQLIEIRKENEFSKVTV